MKRILDTIDYEQRGDDDNRGPWWATLIYRFGPWAVVAAYLIWLISGGLRADVLTIKDDLHQHMYEQQYYMRSMCRSMAISSGTDIGNCEPPQLRDIERAR